MPSSCYLAPRQHQHSTASIWGARLQLDDHPAMQIGCGPMLSTVCLWLDNRCWSGSEIRANISAKIQGSARIIASAASKHLTVTLLLKLYLPNVNGRFRMCEQKIELFAKSRTVSKITQTYQ